MLKAIQCCGSNFETFLSAIPKYYLLVKCEFYFWCQKFKMKTSTVILNLRLYLSGIVRWAYIVQIGTFDGTSGMSLYLDSLYPDGK